MTSRRRARDALQVPTQMKTPLRRVAADLVQYIDLDNVGALLGEALKIADLTSLEIHGPEEELAKLRDPLAELNPKFFTLEYGFRR